MNRKNFAAAGLICSVLLAGGCLYKMMAQEKMPDRLTPLPAEKIIQLKESTPRQLPLRTIGRVDYFFEDFEKESDGLDLPEGWIATATPGNEIDTWQCATLSDKGQAINGASGWQYAFVLGRPDGKPHDTWLFSPGIHLTEGTHYLDFYTYMPPAVNGTTSVLEVFLCTEQSAESTITEITVCDSPVDVWTKSVRAFTLDTEADYVIGFRCSSPADANATLLDNVRVSDGENPLYGGYDFIEVGDVDVRVGKGSVEVPVWNMGNYPLAVELKECSPEISVSGLPLEVAEWDEESGSGEGTFTVTVNLNEPQEYTGHITLKTNDSLHPEIQIGVYAVGKEYGVSNYISESFEFGKPDDWDMSGMSFILKAYGAHEGANSWYSGTSHYNPAYDGVGFTTNYVDLGEAPTASFWYKAYYEDWRGNPVEEAKAEDVIVRVLLNDENGDWTEVFSLAPDADLSHVASFDFQKVEIPLEKYAGQTRRIRVAFSKAEGGNAYSVLVDDVKAGTSPDGDIALSVFEGPTCLGIDEAGKFKLTIINQGAEPLTYAALQLRDMNSDTVLKRFSCPEIEPFTTYEFEFEKSFNEAGSYRLAMTATNWNDPNEDNNTSYPLHLAVVPEDNSAYSIDNGDESFLSMMYPMNFNSLESKSQTIYYANELGTNKGDINSIVYESRLNEPYLSGIFSVYVAETELEDFSCREFIPEDCFTKVFEGKLYFQKGVNSCVIPFSQPYSYHGGNLVVMTKREADMFMYGVNFLNLRDADRHERSIEASSLTSGALFGDEASYTPSVSMSFPQMTVNMVNAPSGTLEGTITDENSRPVAGAKVTLAGTCLFTYSDSRGWYRIPHVAAGSVSVNVNAEGYYPYVSEEAEVEESSTAVLDLTVKAYPTATLKGNVISELSGTGIEKVTVVLEGYSAYQTYTDSEGNYELRGITADTGVDYKIRFEHPYFRPRTSALHIDSDIVENISLKVKPSRPNRLSISTDEANECHLSWKEPLVEYSYDSGEPTEFVGWNGGHAGTVAGVRFLRKTDIEEISWYCSSTPSGHDHFNIIIFGLYPDGRVNPNNILYVAEDVPNTDDAWSTYRLPRKLSVDGYMVAVSCDGFLSIGVCEPTEDTPFELGQNFYAGVDFTYMIQEMAAWKDAHFMIRAYGTDKGEWSGKSDSPEALLNDFVGKPVPEYNVYRFAKDAPQDEWEKVAVVAETEFSDPDFMALDKGQFRYAVTASYGTEESIPSMSAIIDKSTSGILTVGNVDVKVSLQGDALIISDPVKVSSVQVHTLSGRCVVDESKPSGIVPLVETDGSVLIVTFKTIDGMQKSFKVVRQ